MLSLAFTASAANGVWNGTQTAYWTNSANWSVSPYPSVAETASFTNSGSGQTVVNLTGLSSIKYITYDSPLVAAYTNGTGATNSQTLVMADSGEFKLSAAAGNSQVFNCGVQLGTDKSAQSYSFRNDNATQKLTFNNVFGAGSSGTAGVKALTVNGVGDVAILGNIQWSGPSGLTITDASSGTLKLTGSNIVTTLNMNAVPYSIVDIGSGYLYLTNLGSTVLTSSQGGTINGTGTIRLSTDVAPNYGDVKPAAGKTLVINPSIISTGGFELNDSGTVVLNGTNTFAGDIYYTAANGTVSASRIGNKGSTTSNLGMGSKIMESTTIANCRLLYTGVGEISDRIFEFSQNFTVEHAGTGKLRFTAPPNVLANSKTLTLQGSTAGIGEFSGAISNGTGTTSLTKNGSGTWILSGTNLYAGATTVNGGTLLVNYPGSTLASSAFFVNMGAMLGGSGTVNGAVTVANGGALAAGNVNSFGTLTLGSSLTLTNSTLFFDIDAMNVSTDRLAVAGAVTLAGTNTVILTFPGGVAPVGTNTLMTFASLGGTGTFALAPGYGSAFLITTSTSVSLAVTNTGTYGLTWKGTDSNAWDGGALNWTNGAAAVAFNDGDAVLFDDTTLNYSVSSAGTVSPASVTFNNSANTYAVSASLGGAAPLLKLGSGTATLSGNNTLAGPASISGGTLKIGGAGVLGGGTYVNNILNAGILEYASSATQTNSGVISGPGILSVSGSGVLTLSGNNTYSGQTTVYGSGTLILSGNSTTWASPITVFSGTLKALSPNALGAVGAGTFVTNAGILELAGGVTLAAEPLTLAGTLSSQIGTNTYAGAITFQPGASINVGAASPLILSAATVANTYGFTKVGVGLLRLTADPAQTGPFIVNEGTVELQHSGSTDASFIIAPGATVREITAGDMGDYSVTNNGTLDMRASDTIGTLVGNGLVTIGIAAANTLGIGNDSKSGTFSGVIENGLGTLSLTKYGTGIQTLTGVNTYTGPTVLAVNGGTLLVNAPGSLAAASAVTVSSGSTLGGNGTVNGPVTVLQGGALSAGSNGTVDTLPLASTLSLTGGTLFADISTAAGACDLIAVSGALTLSGVNTVALAFPYGTAPVGDYTLMTFPSKTGTGSFALLTSYPNASLELGATSLVLHITSGSISALTWNGNLSAVWDGGIQNWKLGSSSASFATGSSVTFDDSALGPYVSTISSGSAVTPGTLLFNTYANAYTLSANIAGTGALVKMGNTAAALSGLTTYNPTSITVYAGTLSLSSASVLNSGNYANSIVLNGGTFNPGSSAAQTLGGVISGVGALNKNGTGTTYLTGTNSFSGGSTVSAGVLCAKGNPLAFGTGALTLGGGTLELDNDSALTVNNIPTVTASTTVKAGRLTAGPGVTHTLGTLSIGNYTLSVSTGTAVTANSPYGVTFGATTMSAATPVFDVANNGTAVGTLTLGALSGNYNFTKQNSGMLYLGTASGRSGGTATMTAGTLKLGNASALGTTATALQLNGGTLDAATDTTVNAYNTIVGGNATIQSDKATANSEGITHTFGTLNIGSFILTVTNGPNVRLHSPFGLTFSTTSVSNSVFDVGKNGNGQATLTLGPVSGNFAMTKRGTGALRLASVNLHSGATTNSNGKLLVVTGGSSSNSTAVIQASGVADAAPALSVLYATANTQWTYTNLITAAAAAPATALPSLEFAYAVAPSTNVAPLRVLNALTFGTNPVVNVYMGNLTVPTNSYPLIVVGVSAPTNVPPLNMIGGYTNSSLSWSGNTLMLNLSGSPTPIKWIPGASNSGTWDVNNSANLVWTNTVAAAYAYYQELVGAGTTGDSVLFDDTTLTADSTATLNTFVSPTSMTVSNTLYGYTFTGAGAIAGPTALTKYNTNLLTLATANTYTGATTIVSGALTIPAGGGINVGNTANSGQLTLGTVAGNTVMNISGGTVNVTKTAAPSIQVGTANSSVGVINLSAGTLTTAVEIWMGSGVASTTGFGALNVSGGNATFGSYIALGRNSVAGGLSRGELLVSGGTVTVNSQYIEIGSYYNAVGSTCVATLSGGTTTLGAAALNISVGASANGILNVLGTAAVNILNPASALAIGGKAAGGVIGIMNLNGGTVTVPAVTQFSGNTSYFNFNGGTLKSNRANPSFMAGLTAARIFGGGAVIDDGGYAITIAQPLLSPATGSGVSLAGMTFSGSGFIAPPIVDIAGYGVGASAIATIDASGTLTGVTLTCPGVGYMGTPTLTFTGGGGTVTQTGSASTAPNTSGGLTKLGAGSLTLTAANTYSGSTVVSDGRLVVVSGASCSNSALTVQSSGSAANAALGVRYTGSNAQSAIASLTTGAGIGGGGTPDLEFAFTAVPSASVAPLAVTGDATFSMVPEVRVYLSNLTVPNGVYPLMTVGGSAPVSVPALFMVGGYAGSTLSWSGKTLLLNLAGSSSPITWSSGAAGIGTWNVNVSTNLAWMDAAAVATYYQEPTGLSGDQVVFNDAYISTNTTVTLGATVAPTSVTANNSAYAYTLAGSGSITGTASLVKSGAGTFKLSTANLYSGGTAIAAGGVLEVANAGGVGTGAVANNGMLNLTAGAVTYTGLSAALTGSGTNNVTVSTGSANTSLLGDYSGFIGIWNVGIGAAAGAGKAIMNGLDNPAATVRILTNATVMCQSGTHTPALILQGGDTGESYGQLRLEGNANWTGPITLAAPMTNSTDAFFGCNAGNGYVSGVIDDLGSGYTVDSIGAGTNSFLGANTYVGQTWVKQGTLRVPSFGNINSGASPLGAQTNAALSTVKLGFTTTGGTLMYAGMGETSDRPFDMAGTTATAAIDMAGTNSLVLLGDITSSLAGNKQLRLQGSTIGTGVVAGVIYDNGTSSSNTLFKTGTGTWKLTANNQFKGNITVDNGGLVITKSESLGNWPKSISIANNQLGADPHFHLNGTDGNIVVPATVTFNTSSIRAGAIHNDSGTNTIQGAIVLTSGDGDTHLYSDLGKLIINGNVGPNINSRGLHLRGNGDGEINGNIAENTTTNMPLYRDFGSGTWALTGYNTYSGLTSVTSGTLALSGANGSIAGCYGVLITSNATFIVSNSALANNPNRLNDNGTNTLSGGAFVFAHTAGTADYSERTGPLLVTLGTNTVLTSQADVGQTSVVTFASLSRSSGATVNFMGNGLGESDQNRIFITAQADGLLGTWATVNGTNLAAYSAALGVHAAGLADANYAELAARGPNSVITNSATALARITTPGVNGSITLQGDWTNSTLTVQQSQSVPAIIATINGTTNKTLLTSGLLIAAGQGSMTLGETAGNGYLAPLTSGGSVLIDNDNTNALLTVNAVVANNTTASSLDKYGPGKVVLAGSNTFSGTATVNEGTLEFGGPFGQRLNNVIAGNGALGKSGTNVLQILSANTYNGATYITAGMVRADKDNTFGTTNGTVYITDGATLNVGCTPDVVGTRTKDGINFGIKQFVVSGVGYDGAGVINNVSTASQYNAFSRIALAGNATFGAYQRWDMRSSASPALDLNDYTLTKTGALDLAIHDVVINPGAGNVVVNQGILRFEATTKVNGTSANTATVNNGAMLELYNLTTYVPAWSLVMNDGSYFRGAGTANITNQNVWSGPVTLNGKAYFNAGSANIHWTVAGDISGSGTLVKAGLAPSTLWLLSSNNTYSGQTMISNGTLFARCPGSLPGYTAGKVTVASASTLAVQSGDGANGWSAQQIRDLHDATTFSNNTAVLSIDTTLAGIDYPANLTKAIALTKKGVNALTLAGTNTFTGALTVNGGTLVLPSTSTNVPGAITVSGGSTNTSLVIDGISSTGTNAAFGRLFIGNTAGASGAFIQKAGALSVSPATGSADYLDVGNGGYGYYRMNGGSLTVGQLALAGTSGGSGVFDLYKGTVTIPSANGWLLFNWGTGGGAVLNMFGGSLTAPPSVNDTTLSYSGNAANFSALNMLGSGAFLDTTPNGRSLNMARTASSFLSAINLNSGKLLANKVYAQVTGTPTVFGFDGGTLQACFNTTNGATFLQGLTAALVYPDGAVIDTTNSDVSITIRQSLLAPLGYGVSYIPVLSGGTNYIGAPTVKISGGSGMGATAIATVDLDEGSPTKGQVTGITVTSSGTGFLASDSPTVTLTGGGYTTAATLGATYVSANSSSGGLTKLGSGVLTLAGTNTYGGATVISNGTLRLGMANALPANAAVTVAGGTYDLGGFAVTNGPLTLLSGAVINGTLNAGLTKSGNGTATWTASYASAAPVAVSHGTLQLGGLQPGLYEGRVSGSFDLTTPNPMTATKLSATNAYLFFASPAATTSGGLWPDNTTYIYSGFLWNRATTNEVWTFNKYFDDSVQLKIDNNVVINDGVSNTNLITNYTMSPGPHALELRLGEGSGAVGFGGGYPGVGFDRLGRYTRNAAYFQRFADPGDGSLLTLSNSDVTNLLASASTVDIGADGVLDLGGLTRNLAGVSGSGSISNGTLAVTGTIAPGGTNVIGTLSVAANTTANGTLLVDVDADGNSDRLAVQGNLNMSGLSLQIANPGLLDTHKVYTLMTCTGVRSGTFSSDNLPNTRWHITYLENGTVKLVYFGGTVLIFK